MRLPAQSGICVPSQSQKNTHAIRAWYADPPAKKGGSAAAAKLSEQIDFRKFMAMLMSGSSDPEL
jgi:hypothetical protein